jgi:hypothetical protein
MLSNSKLYVKNLNSVFFLFRIQFTLDHLETPVFGILKLFLLISFNL